MNYQYKICKENENKLILKNKNQCFFLVEEKNLCQQGSVCSSIVFIHAILLDPRLPGYNLGVMFCGWLLG
jgi:hypothetical protein